MGVYLEGLGLGLVRNIRLESGEFIDLCLCSHDSRFNILSRTPGAHPNGLWKEKGMLLNN